MNKGRIKTDNSFLKSKINLRLNHLPDKDEIRILDCFAGESVIWKAIKSQTAKKTTILSIDKKPYSLLRGDNIRYLKVLNLDSYDIIDLDSYGIPFSQLEVLFQRGYRGIIFITFTQSIMGGLPKKMLQFLGYPKSMIEKCPTLLYRNGLEKFKLYLAKQGIKKIYIIRKNTKYYICIDKT